ncbi:integrase core domain protein [Plakobranchus ocellatus]|uniref:Integrase core domain protein n=1 Tax=Plakobranchus ocellatus TaxID=259542 RepID=A0AAV4D793_9GAST|nr:integrase core domain protein [Plakobranchus ocellatus]
MIEDGFYRLGTGQEILNQLYARAESNVCSKELMRAGDVRDHETSLPSAATYQFTGSSQGFVRCICKTKCLTVRCLRVKRKKMQFKMSLLSPLLQQVDHNNCAELDFTGINIVSCSFGILQ